MGDDPRLGRRVAGKYELLRVLGIGGMATVFEARHAITGERVAVKLPRPGVVATEESAQRFLREARAPAEVGHPALVRVYDAGADEDGSLYLVLELLEGETLEDAIRRGGLSVKQTFDIIVAVLDALSAVHRAGFVHRDVKPGNVFLSTGQPRVRLMDLGLVRGGDASGSFVTGVGTMLGTPAYMSPEQFRGTDVDAATDIWSVGATLYHALTGRPPFASEDDQLLMSAIVDGAPPRLSDSRPDLPGSIGAIVDGAMRRDPSQRWRSAEDMATAIRRLDVASAAASPASPHELAHAPTAAAPSDVPLAHASTVAAPSDHPEKIAHAPRRSAWPWIAGFVLVVAGAGAGGWALWITLSEAPEPSVTPTPGVAPVEPVQGGVPIQPMIPSMETVPSEPESPPQRREAVVDKRRPTPPPPRREEPVPAPPRQSQPEPSGFDDACTNRCRNEYWDCYRTTGDAFACQSREDQCSRVCRMGAF